MKQPCRPKEGDAYDLYEIIDMVLYDIGEGLIEMTDVDLLHHIRDTESVKIYAKNRYIRYIIRREGSDYILDFVDAIPINDRLNCGSVEAEQENFGRRFMGLGGNSKI